MSLDSSAVLAALEQVVDPELGCSIVDLGLVYDVQIHEGRIRVAMTLTSAGCPLQESLIRAVELALWNLEGVQDVSVNLVWNPPWTPARMTERGRARIG